MTDIAIQHTESDGKIHVIVDISGCEHGFDYVKEDLRGPHDLITHVLADARALYGPDKIPVPSVINAPDKWPEPPTDN